VVQQAVPRPAQAAVLSRTINRTDSIYVSFFFSKKSGKKNKTRPPVLEEEARFHKRSLDATRCVCGVPGYLEWSESTKRKRNEVLEKQNEEWRDLNTREYNEAHDEVKWIKLSQRSTTCSITTWIFSICVRASSWCTVKMLK
jgi:hypothetical protein